jgi:hypothetical protein
MEDALRVSGCLQRTSITVLCTRNSDQSGCCLMQCTQLPWKALGPTGIVMC